MVEFIQCLGRKRVQDAEDTVKLYFYDNFQKIAGLYSYLEPVSYTHLISDYQSWTAGIYLIDAPCGSGKSTFIFKTLYPYAHQNGKRMLVFSNRLALKAQQEHQAFGTDIRCV